MKLLVALILSLTVIVNPAAAQQKPRFWDDVQTIKQYDKMYAPPSNPVLFIGSSSIRKWDDLERTFAAYRVMNRGIGGAVTNDITFYLNDIVFPYHPRQIFIYVGENDLPDSTTTPDSILQRTKVLLAAIREKLPDVPIEYISLKPSPVRAQFMQKAIETNRLIRTYIQAQKGMRFIDIFPAMLMAGKSRPELFVGDRLHMNAKGYAIWRAAVAPHLLKNK